MVPDLIVGDGRLRLRDAPDAAYDLIVVDAFSSDAVPVHLLTREALLLYDRKLRAGGAMLFNVSNRYIDLAPMLGATARPLGLVAYDRDDDTEDLSIGLFPSQWVLVGRPGALTTPTAQWTAVDVHPGDRDWTDDYSNVLAVVRPVRLARDLLHAAWRRVLSTTGGTEAAGVPVTRPQ